jgi:hypothetical protein
VSDAAVRRLVFWNRFWLCLLLIAVGARWLFLWFDAFHTSLRVIWTDSGLRLTTASDGPFVVTHLALMGWEVGSENQKAVAPLPQPIAIIDSDGAIISAAELSKLTWRNVHGQPAPPPPTGAPLRALYYRPLFTPSAGQ